MIYSRTNVRKAAFSGLFYDFGCGLMGTFEIPIRLSFLGVLLGAHSFMRLQVESIRAEGQEWAG